MTLSVLAFDFGTKNIGIAFGQALTQNASPLAPVRAKDGIPNWDEIHAVITEWKPEVLVVGLPFNMDGTDSELTRRARKFGNRLNAKFKLKVEFIDERLTSREAKEIAAERGHKGNYKQAPVDALAAAIILESFWEQREKN